MARPLPRIEYHRLVVWGIDDETGGRLVLDIMEFKAHQRGARRSPRAWKALARKMHSQPVVIERRSFRRGDYTYTPF